MLDFLYERFESIVMLMHPIILTVIICMLFLVIKMSLRKKKKDKGIGLYINNLHNRYIFPMFFLIILSMITSLRLWHVEKKLIQKENLEKNELSIKEKLWETDKKLLELEINKLKRELNDLKSDKK